MQKTFRKIIKGIFFKLGLNNLRLPPRIEAIDYSIHITGQILSKFKHYIPHNSSAIDFESLSIILNDICINNRKSIIEFGSGFSTIAIAKLIQLNNLKCDFISVEHDEGWLKHTKELLFKEGLENDVNMQYMPLENDWYNLDFIKEINVNSTLFDSLIIDGPPANTYGHEYSRKPVMLKLNDYLANNCFILMHDTDRLAENQIVKNWEKIYHIRFNQIGKSSYCIKGLGYNVF